MLPRSAPCCSASILDNAERKHHATLVVLGDVAVRHPHTCIRNVQQKVHRLPGSHQHGVFPDKVRLKFTVARQYDEVAGAVDVDWVVRGVMASAMGLSSCPWLW